MIASSLPVTAPTMASIDPVMLAQLCQRVLSQFEELLLTGFCTDLESLLDGTAELGDLQAVILQVAQLRANLTDQTVQDVFNQDIASQFDGTGTRHVRGRLTIVQGQSRSPMPFLFQCEPSEDPLQVIHAIASGFLNNPPTLI